MEAKRLRKAGLPCYTVAMERYFRHKIEKLLVIDKIVTVHWFEFDRHFRSAEESHDFWEIVYADKGGLVCTADDRTLTLSEGHMLFHKPDERHSLAADGAVAPNVFVVSFECRSAAMRFFENRILPLPKDLRKSVYSIVDDAKRTFDIPFSDPDAHKMELLPAPTLGGRQLIKNRLEILLIELMRRLTETQDGNRTFLPDADFGNRLVRDTIAVMNEHLGDALTIADICRLTHYGRAHLFEQFKAATGRSVMACYAALRIDAAKRLLRETDLSVAQIADRLGFDTPNYFSKTFRRLTSVTPSAYRKRTAT